MVRVQVEKKEKTERGVWYGQNGGGALQSQQGGVLRSQRRGGDFSANGGSPSESTGEVLESQRECFGNNGGSC